MEVERCPDCGTPPHLCHLRNCKQYGDPSFKTGTNAKASRSQLDLATDLINQLGHNEEDYKLNTLTGIECSKLITLLMAERG